MTFNIFQLSAKQERRDCFVVRHHLPNIIAQMSKPLHKRLYGIHGMGFDNFNPAWPSPLDYRRLDFAVCFAISYLFGYTCKKDANGKVSFYSRNPAITSSWSWHCIQLGEARSIRHQIPAVWSCKLIHKGHQHCQRQTAWLRTDRVFQDFPSPAVSIWVGPKTKSVLFESLKKHIIWTVCKQSWSFLGMSWWQRASTLDATQFQKGLGSIRK